MLLKVLTYDRNTVVSAGFEDFGFSKRSYTDAIIVAKAEVNAEAAPAFGAEELVLLLGVEEIHRTALPGVAVPLDLFLLGIYVYVSIQATTAKTVSYSAALVLRLRVWTVVTDVLSRRDSRRTDEEVAAAPAD
jgi:hypothetical protein